MSQRRFAHKSHEKEVVKPGVESSVAVKGPEPNVTDWLPPLLREKDVAKFIAELLFEKLISNIREVIKIASLAGNKITKAQRIADM